MRETDFDRELLVSNLLEAKSLEALYEKEKILTNAKMIMLQNSPVIGQLNYRHLKDIAADEMLKASVYGAKGNLYLMEQIFIKGTSENPEYHQRTKKVQDFVLKLCGTIHR